MADEKPTSGSGILGEIFTLGRTFAVPLANKLVYGKDQNANAAVVQERLDDNALNGSGPNDPRGATQAPTDIQTFIAGPTSAPASTTSPMMKFAPMAIMALVVVVLLVMLRK